MINLEIAIIVKNLAILRKPIGLPYKAEKVIETNPPNKERNASSYNYIQSFILHIS